MEDFIFSLLKDRGEIVAGVVSFLVIVAGLILRNKGWFLPDKTSAVPDSQIAALSDKVGAIDNRLRQVEHDVEHLPTRTELHRLHLQIVGLDGKMNALEKTGNASSASLARLEDHLYNLARANK